MPITTDYGPGILGLLREISNRLVSATTEAIGVILATISSTVSTISTTASSIKTKTDSIPTDPAKESGKLTDINAKLPASLGQKTPATSLAIAPPTATVTTLFAAGTTMDTDRTSSVINKSGLNKVSIDLTFAMGGAGPFNAVGIIKVFAGNTDSITTADALATPILNISAVGVQKLEFECDFPYIGVWYDRTSDGDDDTITGTIGVSE